MASSSCQVIHSLLTFLPCLMKSTAPILLQTISLYRVAPIRAHTNYTHKQEL